MSNHYLKPAWPAPANINAYTTLRSGGFSQAPFDSFNLGPHVNDNPAMVAKNVAKLVTDLMLPATPVWLNQVHGTKAVAIDNCIEGERPAADACYTKQSHTVCAVLTADCLPILLCDQAGTQIAAIHAGWRGLLAGVIDNTIAAMDVSGKDFMAWLGPAIGPRVFDLNAAIRLDFIQRNPDNSSCFKHKRGNVWTANIYELARINLRRLGIRQVYGGEHCTFSDSQRFFSYRRDQTTGRIASLIWLT
ncbi:MAG: peptidoglycan editing factor PgeF [Gammaproteobacteria bacterium]|nr:peptidoglycan editing factor PgeF [Gammaproteobacteria bacterium]